MVYGKKPKDQAEAGVNLVKSHLMENKSAGEALKSINNRMRQASRFVPTVGSESSEAEEGLHSDGSYNN